VKDLVIDWTDKLSAKMREGTSVFVTNVEFKEINLIDEYNDKPVLAKTKDDKMLWANIEVLVTIAINSEDEDGPSGIADIVMLPMLKSGQLTKPINVKCMTSLRDLLMEEMVLDWDDVKIPVKSRTSKKQHISSPELLAAINEEFEMDECIVVELSHCSAVVSHNHTSAVYTCWMIEGKKQLNIVEVDIEKTAKAQ